MARCQDGRPELGRLPQADDWRSKEPPHRLLRRRSVHSLFADQILVPDLNQTKLTGRCCFVWWGWAGPKKKETEELRIKIKDGLEQQALDFFQKEGGQVVIYDANNSIRESRLELWARFKKLGVHVIFLGASYFSSSCLTALACLRVLNYR